jgi:hypothetical protein
MDATFNTPMIIKSGRSRISRKLNTAAAIKNIDENSRDLNCEWKARSNMNEARGKSMPR